MDIENATYDPAVTLTVTGQAGLFKGEEIHVRLGQAVVVGRSRMCDVSVARTAECQRLGKEAMENHRSYRKISRKHFKISLIGPDLLEVEDLSTNGTVVNGYKVDRLQIPQFYSAGKTAKIEFGDGEILLVSCGNKSTIPSTELHTEGRKMPQMVEDDEADDAFDPADPLEKTPIH